MDSGLLIFIVLASIGYVVIERIVDPLDTTKSKQKRNSDFDNFLTTLEEEGYDLIDDVEKIGGFDL